jgi:hypothetical protein
MGASRLWGLVLVFSILGASWAESASADSADSLYDPSKMYVVELSLPQKSRQGLAADSDKYQPGTFSLAETDGTPGGVKAFSAPVSVEIKLKGSASRRPLSGKSAFKIKFDEAPFRGLRVITLNNMVEDPSMIHETLAYTAFRGAGVPASRSGYAYVYVDGVDYGVHLDIEALDELALEKRFGPFDAEAQHLYEGEDGWDVHPGGAGQFEIDAGGPDRGDLEALVDAVNSSGSLPWASRVASAIDLREMTRMWAVEKYIGQWDGYAGSEGEEWLPNNYYLYSDPSGRFQMLPWGNDESWQAAYHLSFDGGAGLMFDRCLEDEACAAIYRESVAAVRDAIAGMDLDALAGQTAALLAPWQELEAEASTREEHSIGEIQHGVAETREFIASRPAEVAEWLGEKSQTRAEPASPGSALPTPDRVVHFPAPGFRIDRPQVQGSVLRTRVHPWTKGVVAMRVMISTGKGSAVICRDKALVGRAHGLTLHCLLPAAVRQRLRRRSLEITVFTRFLPAGGNPESITRRVTLPHA